MTGPSFEYEARRPAGELGRFVEEIWFARGTIRGARERISPTGSTVLGIVLGSPIRQWSRDGAGELHEASEGFLIGPHDQPIVNEPTAETWAVGIVTTPTGCETALGIPPRSIRGRVASARGWSAFGRVRSALLDAVGAQESLDIVESALRAGAREVPGLERVERAVRLLSEEPTAHIATIAATLGVSHGHLDREFRRVVGLGPRVLGRIIRLRRLLNSIDVYGRVEWTRLAADLGWFDQAHLIRDFRRFTGVTPSEYAAAQRDVYAPGEAHAGFVPDVQSVQ